MRCSRRTRLRAKRRFAKRSRETFAAAPATSRSSRRCSSPRRARKVRDFMGSVPDLLGLGAAFRYIGKKRRTKEDPRFVTGHGRYVADVVLPGLKHVALLTSPHAAALIK